MNLFDFYSSSVKIIKKANSAVSSAFSSIFGGGGGAVGNLPNLNGFMPLQTQMASVPVESKLVFYMSTFLTQLIPKYLAADVRLSVPSDSGLSLQTLVALMEPVLTPELVRSIGAVYQFEIVDLGDFYINLKEGEEGNALCSNLFLPINFTFVGSGHARVGTVSNPDVTIQVQKEDSWKIFTGQLDPFEAYMRGEIQVRGNLQVAMKLQLFRDVWATHCRTAVMKP